MNDDELQRQQSSPELRSFKRALAEYVREPVALSLFVEAILRPLGLEEEHLADATIEQNLPVERTPDDQILATFLPFGSGPWRSRLFVVVDPRSGMVLRAAVFP